MTYLKSVLLLLAVGFGFMSPAQGQLSTIGVSLVITNEGSPEYTFPGAENPEKIEIPLFGNEAKISIFDNGEGIIHLGKPLRISLRRNGVRGELVRVVRDIKFKMPLLEGSTLRQLESNPSLIVGTNGFGDVAREFFEKVSGGADPSTLDIPKLFKVVRVTLHGGLDMISSQEPVQVQGVVDLREVIGAKGELGDLRIKAEVPSHDVYELTDDISQRILRHTGRANGLPEPFDPTVPQREARILRPNVPAWNCKVPFTQPVASGQ